MGIFPRQEQLPRERFPLGAPLAGQSPLRGRMAPLIGALIAGLIAGAGCSRSSSNNSPRLVINEVMANGDAASPGAVPLGVSLLSPDGSPADWVEIYNPLETAVNLSGYSLTDKPDNPKKYRFPPLTLQPGEFVVVVLDGDPDAGPLHGSFRLSAKQDEVYLFSRGGGDLVDRRTYRDLPSGVTAGLYPDGKENYGLIYTPTPGGKNYPINLQPPRITHFLNLQPGDTQAVLSITIEKDAGTQILRAETEWALTATFKEEAPEPANRVDLLNADLIPRRDMDPPPPAKVRPDAYGNTYLDKNQNGIQDEGEESFLFDQEASIFTVSIPVDEDKKVFHIRTVLETRDNEVVRVDRLSTALSNITLLINEFTPSNRSLRFDQYNHLGVLTRPNQTPDWIELFNYGDQAIPLKDIALIGDKTYKELTKPSPSADLFVWTFGDVGIESIGARERLLILAHDDNPYDSLGNSAYKSFALSGTENRDYRSTNFVLSKDKRDSFWLLEMKENGEFLLIDWAIFNFSDQGGGTVVPDISFGRHPDAELQFVNDPDAREKIRPLIYPSIEGAAGEFLFPTPWERNRMANEVDILPEFEESVWVEPRCAGPGFVATITAFVALDSDTSAADSIDHRTFDVALSYTAAGKTTTLGRGAGLDVHLTTEFGTYDVQEHAGTRLWTIIAKIPGQNPGTLVTFELRARDDLLMADGEWIVHSEDTAPLVSFRYKPGYKRPDIVINEVFPNALPDEPTLPPINYIELFNKTDEPQNLKGMFLHYQKNLDMRVYGPIRRFEFTEDTWIEPYGFRCIYFPEDDQVDQVPVDGLSVSGFGIECSGSAFLLAPDEEGNCIVSGVSWYTKVGESDNLHCPTELNDAVAVGMIPDGEIPPSRLMALDEPSPCAYNLACPGNPPEIYRQPYRDGVDCVKKDSFFVIQAEVLIDSLAAQEYPAPTSLGVPTGIKKAELIIERNGVESTLNMSTSSLERPAGVNSCFIRVKVLRSPPTPHPEVTLFRVRITDGLDQIVESEQFSYGLAGTKPPVAINEVMVFNTETLQDENGDYPPWIELYNGDAGPIDFGGMYLTNDIGDPLKWQIPRIPEAVVPSRGFLVVFADGDRDNPDDLHARFLLSSANSQGDLYLLDSPENGTCLIDQFHYDLSGLTSDHSMGRIPDGTGGPVIIYPKPSVPPNPSPGKPNVLEVEFIRGDVWPDGKVNLTDLTRFYRILDNEPLYPPCRKRMDVNDDGAITIDDGVYLGDYLFLEGAPPPEPYPLAGVDPTPDGLICE